MSRNTRAPEAAYPRVTIEYCTKCKWMLRAAYFAQELLSTFQSSLAEVSLRPSLQPGTFAVHITHLPEQASAPPPLRKDDAAAPAPPPQSQEAQLEDVQEQALNDQNASVQDAPDPTTPATQTVLLWDRTVDGGFPEAKELKRRVRDVIEPDRNLGHNERGGAATGTQGRVVASVEAGSGSREQAGQPRDMTAGACVPGPGCEDCA